MTSQRRTQILLCSLMTSAAGICFLAFADAASRSGLIATARAETQVPPDASQDPNADPKRERKHRNPQNGQQPGARQPGDQAPPAQGQQGPHNAPRDTAAPVVPAQKPPVAAPVTTPPKPPAPPAAQKVTTPPAPQKPIIPPIKNSIAPPPSATPSAPTQKTVVPAPPASAPRPPLPAAAAKPPATKPAAAPAAAVVKPPVPPATTAAPVARPAAAAAAAAAAAPAERRFPQQVRNLQQLQEMRKQRLEAGGKRVVITEPDKREIIKQNNQTIIKHDESATIQKLAPTARVERGKLGSQTAIIDRPNGQQVITETDRKGNLIRRFRRDADGREQVIIDNRKRDKFGRNLAIGVGIGAGVIAGAAIINEITSVRAPRVEIPREKYVVRGEDASEDDVYEAFEAPPVDRIERRYSLDEVRATRNLRDRMRRVDLDDINFETGSWDVDPGEFRKLDRVARAMLRVIRRDDNEVFLIEGYTDAVGSDDDNLTLSDRRAEAVAEVLTREFNVPPENLTTQGYGEQYLKIDTDGPERANRRVALRRITPLLAQQTSAPPPPPPPPRVERDDERDYRDRAYGDPYNDRRRAYWRRHRRDF